MRRIVCTTSSSVAFAVAGMLCLAGCDLDVPDLNNPGLDQLAENPTPPAVSAACTGLIIGSRGNQTGIGAANGYVSQLGIVGRESYNFDGADPRFIGELLAGPLVASSAFGGAFWQPHYTNIRLGNIILAATDAVEGFDDTQKQAIRGFVRTIMALDLLHVIATHDSIGAVIDTNRDIHELGAIVSKEEVYAEIARLLDEGQSELMEGGTEFPFNLSTGFAGFEGPATTFLQFNRAMAARIAVYREEYDAAITAIDQSFLGADPTSVEGLERGVYYSFSTGAGDVTNQLNNPNIYGHPSLLDDAEIVSGSGDTAIHDQRYERKIRQVADNVNDPAGSAQGVSSKLKFRMYVNPDDKIWIIKAEELVLLRAEARWAQGDLPAATADLNLVRTISGGLPPLADGLSADAIEDQILYNRRYSLMFESGHRWIDARRFSQLDLDHDGAADRPEIVDEQLPLAVTMDDCVGVMGCDPHVRNLRYPLPTDECDARPGEPRCLMDSLE